LIVAVYIQSERAPSWLRHADRLYVCCEGRWLANQMDTAHQSRNVRTPRLPPFFFSSFLIA